MLSFSILSSLLLFLFPASFNLAASTIITSRSSLVRRAQYCSNAPAVVAGTKVPTNSQGPIYPLPHLFNIIWCTVDTETYLIINPGSPIASATIVNVLKGAGRAVSGRIAAQGDGMLQDGRFTWYQRGDSHVTLQVQNANNHQVTYGVLASALAGMELYMWNVGYGAVQFKLYDGPHQVGQGSIGFG